MEHAHPVRVFRRPGGVLEAAPHRAGPVQVQVPEGRAGLLPHRPIPTEAGP